MVYKVSSSAKKANENNVTNCMQIPNSGIHYVGVGRVIWTVVLSSAKFPLLSVILKIK